MLCAIERYKCAMATSDCLSLDFPMEAFCSAVGLAHLLTNCSCQGCQLIDTTDKINIDAEDRKFEGWQSSWNWRAFSGRKFLIFRVQIEKNAMELPIKYLDSFFVICCFAELFPTLCVTGTWIYRPKLITYASHLHLYGATKLSIATFIHFHRNDIYRI